MNDRQCDSVREQPAPEGCSGVAAVIWFCRVEGREVRLCRTCDLAWKKLAREQPGLLMRCPNCAAEYFRMRQVQADNLQAHRTGNLTENSQPYTGPLAEAIDRALLAEGVLGDTRKRVLSRLANDSDPYIATLLRSVSGAAA